MKKTIAIVLLTLLLVLGGGAYYFMTNINAIVKSAIEKYGSEITQTDVDVKDVDISLTTGAGSVSGFRIGSPKSFVAARSLEVDSVSMEVDTSTPPGSGPIVINNITVRRPQITYEINAAGQNNLNTIRDNISGSKTKESSSADQTADVGATKKPSRNVIIKNLYIEEGEVSVTYALLQGREIKTDLPPIHLTNIGEEGSGVTPERLGQIVLGEVIKKASNAGGKALRQEMPNLEKIGNDAAKEIGDAVKGLFSR